MGAALVNDPRVDKIAFTGAWIPAVYHPTYNEAPWGCYKQSRFGRELGPYGLEAYLEPKQIKINLTDAPLRRCRFSLCLGVNQLQACSTWS